MAKNVKERKKIIADSPWLSDNMNEINNGKKLPVVSMRSEQEFSCTYQTTLVDDSRNFLIFRGMEINCKRLFYDEKSTQKLSEDTTRMDLRLIKDFGFPQLH